MILEMILTFNLNILSNNKIDIIHRSVNSRI